MALLAQLPLSGLRFITSRRRRYHVHLSLPQTSGAASDDVSPWKQVSNKGPVTGQQRWRRYSAVAVRSRKLSAKSCSKIVPTFVNIEQIFGMLQSSSRFNFQNTSIPPIPKFQFHLIKSLLVFCLVFWRASCSVLSAVAAYASPSILAILCA